MFDQAGIFTDSEIIQLERGVNDFTQTTKQDAVIVTTWAQTGINKKPVDLKAVYPWQGMVRKKYSDVYLTAFRDESGRVFAARYGSRIFPKA